MKVELDFENDRVYLNRQTSSPYLTTQDRQGADYIFSNNDSVYLRVFIDHSTIEVFIDDIVVMSARAYPHPNQNQFAVKCQSGSANLSGRLYPLYGMLDSNNLYHKYCDPLNLPSGLNGYISIEEQATDHQPLITPNPSSDIIQLMDAQYIGSRFVIVDQTAKIVKAGVLTQSNSISNLPQGSYFLRIPEHKKSFKFIKL